MQSAGSSTGAYGSCQDLTDLPCHLRWSVSDQGHHLDKVTSTWSLAFCFAPFAVYRARTDRDRASIFCRFDVIGVGVIGVIGAILVLLDSVVVSLLSVSIDLLCSSALSLCIGGISRVLRFGIVLSIASNLSVNGPATVESIDITNFLLFRRVI